MMKNFHFKQPNESISFGMKCREFFETNQIVQMRRNYGYKNISGG